MLNCTKCKKEIESDSTFCRFCGKKLCTNTEPGHNPKRRGNGQGTVYKCGKKWKAEVTLGYTVSTEGTVRRKKRTKVCETKKEALDILPELRHLVIINKNPTFMELYNEWLPIHSRKVSRSSINCYKAAYLKFKSLYYMRFSELRTEHWQKALDACQLGVRTKENMKALGTLLYTYAISQDVVDKNYAQFAYINKPKAKPEKAFFDPETLDMIFKAAKTDVRARYVVVMCYTGFRLEEFLSLTNNSYNEKYKYFRGGEKTKAGIDRIVTISPKIQSFVDGLMKEGYIFSESGKKMSSKKFRDKIFYPLLNELGIQEVLPDGSLKYKPHCTRHTFATLMKNVEAPKEDKLRIIGHTSEEMLRHYTHSDIIDLRKITDAI